MEKIDQIGKSLDRKVGDKDIDKIKKDLEN